MPLNHDVRGDSEDLWIHTPHRNVAPLAILGVPSRGAEHRQKVAHGVSRGTEWNTQQSPGRGDRRVGGDWLTRRRAGGRFPAEAQRRREDRFSLTLHSLL